MEFSKGKCLLNMEVRYIIDRLRKGVGAYGVDYSPFLDKFEGLDNELRVRNYSSVYNGGMPELFFMPMFMTWSKYE